ncbi:MAG TPA: tetratricopeptide repeat protein [Bryobacteraceae bacterium]|jgi:tetratricopeptide (TPR) repeat protein|nr:tetratricopeptide repeat protein [Bryobacteraceae bacterium]
MKAVADGGVMNFQSSGIAAMTLAAVTLAVGQPAPEMRNTEQQAVFFSGEVTLQDGSKPPDPVRIQKVCKGVAHDETWTDSKGRFSFKVVAGGSDTTNADPAQGGRGPDLARPIGNSTYYSNPLTTSLRDCEVQAVLAGFWSERVSIALKNTLDDTRIGRIILHPVSGGQALTVSATTLAAPPNASKAYEKGMAAMREQKWDAAQKELTKAVEAYPKFAVAWFELGVLRQSRNDLPGASAAWKEALKSDPKYVKPYEVLAGLAERQQNWLESEKYSHDWIQLDPEDFPAAYLYNAIANARLNKMEQAEASARKGLLLDKEKRIPRLSYVLGLILIEKHELAESAKYLRAYLELAPNAKDAPIVREQLTKIEAAAAAPPR